MFPNHIYEGDPAGIHITLKGQVRLRAMSMRPRFTVRRWAKRHQRETAVMVGMAIASYMAFGIPVFMPMAVITSAGTGDASAGATWVGGVAPVSTDDTIIANTHNVTIDVDGEVWGSVTVQNGGTLTFTSGYELILDDEDAGGDTLDIEAGGTLVNGNGLITITNALTVVIKLGGTGNPYNLTTAGTTQCRFFTNFTVDNNLTVATGTIFRGNNPTQTLTVTGDTDVTGTLGNTASPQSSAYTLGSLTINSGGTYSATSGTTTLTSEAASGYALRVLSGGTVTHNSGLLSITTSTVTRINTTGNSLYSLTYSGGATLQIRLADVAVAGNLSITDGTLDTHTEDNALTVTGTTTIGDGVGLASSAKLTCNSSTVDLNGNLTIDTDGEGSWPDSSGTFTFDGVFVHKGIWTHNDGTCTFDGSANGVSSLSTVVPSFYNLTVNNSANYVYLNDSITVENTLTINASKTLWVNSNNVILTIGTSTSSGSVINNGALWCNTNGTDITIKAASSLYPIICIGTDWNWDAYVGNVVFIQDLDYRIAATTGGGGVTVTMTRCRFPLGMHVSSGDTIKIAGNTASGFLKMEGDGTLQIVRGGGVYTLDGIGDDRMPPPLPTVLNPPNICPRYIEGVDS